ncbi:MAG: S-layer homology domain-containing protein [Dialister pneumosintes]
MGISVYAANPFSDVSPDDWAYKAVSELSVQNIVKEYPDGTFKGEKNITRYEMAQIIAGMLAHEDQYNTEQKAVLDKLANEYADELGTLGVRVANLESKVGNIYWSGDAQFKWVQRYGETIDIVEGSIVENDYLGCMRINAHAQVNDRTYVEGLLRSNINFTYDFNPDDKSRVYIQKLYVHHDFNDKLSVNIGKYGQTFGQTGLLFDGEVKGIEAIAHFNDAANLTVGFGRADFRTNDDVVYARLDGQNSNGRFKYDLEYINNYPESYREFQVWGIGLTIGLTDKIDLFGDYYKNVESNAFYKRPDSFIAGIGFGHQNDEQVGSYRIAASYVNVRLGATTYHYKHDVSPIEGLSSGGRHIKYWLLETDVTLDKNVRLHGEYAFDVKSNQPRFIFRNLASLSLNYVF